MSHHHSHRVQHYGECKSHHTHNHNTHYRTPKGGAPCAVRALCEKSAIFHSR